MSRRDEAVIMSGISPGMFDTTDVAEQNNQKDNLVVQIGRYLSLVEKLRTEIMGMGFREEESVLALIDIFFCQDWDNSCKQYREDAENRAAE